MIQIFITRNCEISYINYVKSFYNLSVLLVYLFKYQVEIRKPWIFSKKINTNN
jgi:hypothetical protein